MSVKKYIIVVLALLCLSCTHHNQTVSKTDTVAKVANTDNLKDISDMKMALLDGKLQKMYDLLGEPDESGHSPSGDNNHYIYYDRVKQNGVVKSLVIFSSYNSYEDSFREISQVEAVSDGQSVRLGRYGIVTVNKPHNFNKQSQGSNRVLIDSINKAVKQLDTTVLPPIFKGALDNGRFKEDIKVYCIHDVQDKEYILIKKVFAIGGGNYNITRYLYYQKKFIYSDERDKDSSLQPTKIYVDRDQCLEYSVNNKVQPCTDSKSKSCSSCNCRFNEYSKLIYSCIKYWKLR